MESIELVVVAVASDIGPNFQKTIWRWVLRQNIHGSYTIENYTISIFLTHLTS